MINVVADHFLLLFIRHTIDLGAVWVDHAFETFIGHPALLNSLDETIIETRFTTNSAWLILWLLMFHLLISCCVA